MQGAITRLDQVKTCKDMHKAKDRDRAGRRAPGGRDEVRDTVHSVLPTGRDVAYGMERSQMSGQGRADLDCWAADEAKRYHHGASKTMCDLTRCMLQYAHVTWRRGDSV